MNRAIAIGFGLVVLVGATTMPAEARPTPAQKCAAAKMKCVAKEFLAALGCHGKAALAGSAVDTACLAKAQSKQGSCWQAAEGKGGCLPTFPAEHLHQDVTDWTTDIAGDLPAS